MDFLPICRSDMKERRWDHVDFVLVSGDAYVDHPSFGVAVISRWLERHQFRVGIIAQPDWRSVDDFCSLGRPRLGFLVTSGNIDSMVNHYTVAKKRRSGDVYSPGGKGRRRPDRAAIVYAQRAREAYRGVPIILGGIEASLRRLAHYDYWEDRVRRSILVDSKADLLIYGMGETAVVEVAEALRNGASFSQSSRCHELFAIRGVVYRTFARDYDVGDVILPDYTEVARDRKAYARSFCLQEQNVDAISGQRLVESYGDFCVVQNPPAFPLAQHALDDIYNLPYAREYHPVYAEQGGVPAITEVKYSLTSNRGCFGGCSFCALTFHQGRVVQSRSHRSLIAEAKEFIKDSGFKGYIHDVGGPTANFRGPACSKQEMHGVCKHRHCLTPKPCGQLRVEHGDYLALLRKLRAIPGVKKVFVRSGIRYDYLLLDPDSAFLAELCEHHVSGQLKVAPEHVSPRVLALMGKPGRAVFDEFVRRYREANRRKGKKQYLIPYFMSSHPGSTLEDAIVLAEYIRDTGLMPEQVQDFYPTPGTLATCMYHTELDPRTMEPVYVAKDPREKAMQRALVHFSYPANQRLVREALEQAGRQDLIGFGGKCLVRPPKKTGANGKKGSSRRTRRPRKRP